MLANSQKFELLEFGMSTKQELIHRTKTDDCNLTAHKETDYQSAPAFLAEFYKPARYEQIKRFLYSTAGRKMRKHPYLTTGLLFFSGGVLFLAAAASTVTTGMDPLLIASVSAALAGASFLTAIGINRLAKHLLKEKYSDKLHNDINSALGFALSASLLTSSACAMASPTAALLYPAIAFTVSTLFFLGNTTVRAFPKLGSKIKKLIGFNPLRFFEKHPDMALVAAGSGLIIGRTIVPAIHPGMAINPVGVADGVVAAILGLSFTVLMAPARSKDGIINKIGKINAIIADSGKDLGSLVAVENGKFKVKDGANQQGQEIASMLNKIYEQIYLYKGEEDFKQLEKSFGAEGFSSARELLNGEHMQPYHDATGKLVDDKKAIVAATEQAKNDLKPKSPITKNQSVSWTQLLLGLPAQASMVR